MRLAVDKMAAGGIANPRQAVWDAIRLMAGEDLSGDLGLAQIVDKTGVQRKTAKDYLLSLVAAGYLTEAGDDVWTMTRDGGAHAPRVRRDGSAVTQGSGTVNLWRSMRMLAKFTPVDLAAHSTTETVKVTENTAQSYCTMLLATGYLRVVQKANPAASKKAIYRLIRNDGPKPPMIQRVKQVFDPNTGKTYQKGGQ